MFMKKKLFVLLLLTLMIFTMISCKRKKSKGRVLNSTPSEPVAFGIHPERGGNIDEVAYIVSIYIPTGANKKGVQVFKKEMYELSELTPEGVDEGLKYYGVISDDSVFCDLKIKKSDIFQNAGPGAEAGKKINDEGIVRYVIDNGYDLQSDLVNEEEYLDVKVNKIEGLITTEDIVEAITRSFKENFQLVNCELGAITYSEYKKIHP